MFIKAVDLTPLNRGLITSKRSVKNSLSVIKRFSKYSKESPSDVKLTPSIKKCPRYLTK